MIIRSWNRIVETTYRLAYYLIWGRRPRNNGNQVMKRKGWKTTGNFSNESLTLFQHVTSICTSKYINEKLPGKIDNMYHVCLHVSVCLYQWKCMWVCGHTHVKPQDQCKVSCSITFYLIFSERVSDSTWNLAI